MGFRCSSGQKTGRSAFLVFGGFGQIGIRLSPSFRMKTGGKHVVSLEADGAYESSKHRLYPADLSTLQFADLFVLKGLYLLIQSHRLLIWPCYLGIIFVHTIFKPA